MPFLEEFLVSKTVCSRKVRTLDWPGRFCEHDLERSYKEPLRVPLRVPKNLSEPLFRRHSQSLGDLVSREWKHRKTCYNDQEHTINIFDTLPERSTMTTCLRIMYPFLELNPCFSLFSAAMPATGKVKGCFYPQHKFNLWRKDAWHYLAPWSIWLA